MIREKTKDGFWCSESVARPDSELWNDVHEVYSLRHACDGFDDFNEPELKRRLQKVIGGHPDIEIEGEKTEARDILFELIIASWLSLRGLRVYLPSEHEEDVRFKLHDVLCHLECKRVQTMSALPRRMKKAASQLRGRLGRAKYQGNRGVIAVDVSKIFTNSDLPLRGTDWDDTAARFQKALREFVVDNPPTLMVPRETRIFAVLFFAGKVGVFDDAGFVSLFGSAVFPLHLESRFNEKLALRFHYVVDDPRSEKNV